MTRSPALFDDFLGRGPARHGGAAVDIIELSVTLHPLNELADVAWALEAETLGEVGVEDARGVVTVGEGKGPALDVADHDCGLLGPGRPD